jgi:hypothetical protein
MATITFANPQVNAAVTYNWTAIGATLGDGPDIGRATTYAPGVGTGTTGVNDITTSVAPLPVYQPVLGQIIQAYEPTLGFGEFIYLQVPKSTAVPLGTVCTWNFSNTGVSLAYNYVISATTANLAVPLAVCVSNTAGATGGITSNANSIQYAWFQISGLVQTLKTAVIHTLNGKIYQSATAGRVMVNSASGNQILGARFASSNSSTISCALVWFDRPFRQGQIT